MGYPYYNPNSYMNPYGANPYYQQPQMVMQPQQVQNVQQPIQNGQFNKPVSLQGEFIDNIKAAETIKYPFDGSRSYFPLTDGSAIITKQLDLETGKGITIKYIPVIEDNENKQEQKEKSKYDSYKDNLNNFKEELKESNKQYFDDISNQINKMLETSDKQISDIKSQMSDILTEIQDINIQPIKNNNNRAGNNRKGDR